MTASPGPPLSGVRYPTIPQLWGSTGTYDDTFMSEDESIHALHRASLTVEKLDGWNVGFSGTSEEPLLKGRPVSWNALPASVERLEQLRSWRERARLDHDHVVFGEWRPDFDGDAFPWCIFDVYLRSTRSFLSWELVRCHAGLLGVDTPRVLHRGPIDDFETLLSLREWSEARDPPMEGVVVRLERGDRLLERFKFVRRGFVKRDCP